MRHIFWIPPLAFLIAITTFARDDLSAQLQKIKLPPGFKIEVLAKIPNARGLAVSPQGTLFIGSRDAGKAYAITREHLKPVKTYELLSDLRDPLGVAYHDGSLYVSATDRILRIAEVEKHLDHPKAEEIVTTLPTEAHHGGRFIAFGPDQKLYAGIGAPCNVCDPGAKYANITRMDATGKSMEVFAQGIRNTVGFDWHPDTHELWFTDNGRDLLGDDLPADEINHAPKKGMNFGFPFCHQGDLLDADFGKGKNCSDYTPPARKLGAHVAALGMRFYTGKMFPEAYHNRIFVAEHGSWNRSKKSGYRVMMATLQGDQITAYEPFAEGFLQGQKAWGRPADVLVDLDGSLLIADDEAGAVYRVSYIAPQSH